MTRLNMKSLYTLPLLVVLSLPSCTTVQSARDKLEVMPETSYQTLIVRVEATAALGGEKLAEALGDRSLVALDITRQLQTAVRTDSLDVADVIRGIADQYGTQLGLSTEHLDYVNDGARLIDAAVGQIRLGIDGALTEREKGLVLALLKGLERGLL